MSDFKVFMKVIEKDGYPNPNLVSIAHAVSYDLSEFLSDMQDSIGLEKTQIFVDKALDKFLGHDKTIMVDVTDENFGPSFVVYKIEYYDYDPEETSDGVYCRADILDSQLMQPDGEMKNIEEIRDEAGMDYSGLDEYEESLFSALNDKVYGNCGFYLYAS
jgi:hypothetical protein